MNTLLSSLRDKIQDIDTALCELLQKREYLVQQIAQYKQDESLHLFAPQQEQLLYSRLVNKGYNYPYIIKEIIAHSRFLQGLICYTLDNNDILFAKLALGFATHVEYVESIPPHFDIFSSLFYIPYSHVQNVENLYTCAIYRISMNNTSYTYHAMTAIPYEIPVEFSICI